MRQSQYALPRPHCTQPGPKARAHRHFTHFVPHGPLLALRIHQKVQKVGDRERGRVHVAARSGGAGATSPASLGPVPSTRRVRPAGGPARVSEAAPRSSTSPPAHVRTHRPGPCHVPVTPEMVSHFKPAGHAGRVWNERGLSSKTVGHSSPRRLLTPGRGPRRPEKASLRGLPLGWRFRATAPSGRLPHFGHPLC